MSHFCPPCRLERNRERSRARMRAIRAAERDARAHLDDLVTLGGMDSIYVGSVLFPRLQDVVDDLEEGEVPPFVIDRMPHGARSPAGPDVGRTGTDADGVIYGRGGMVEQAVGHEWWALHPHWAYELDDPVAAATYLDCAA